MLMESWKFKNLISESDGFSSLLQGLEIDLQSLDIKILLYSFFKFPYLDG